MLRRIILSLLMIVLLAACGGDDEADYPDGVEEAVEHFSDELGIDDDDVIVTSYEQMDWSDACLGLGQANESCAAVITPGWNIEAEIDGQRYNIRSDEPGEIVRWNN